MQDRIIDLLVRVKDEPAVVEIARGSSHLVNDLGLDSIQLINLILLVEEEFDVEVDFDSFQIEHLSSLSRFADFISGLPRRS